MIYLDSGATSLYRPPQVIEAVRRSMMDMGNASRGSHGPSLLSSRCIFECRMLLAQLFGAEGPEQIVFTLNATDSLNMAVRGLLNPGDRVVTTVMEHNSVLRPLYEMEAGGVRLDIVGTDEKGCLDMKAMEQAINPGIRAVICTHASNVTGNVNDIRTIGRWCREKGSLFIVDGAQTAGVFPVDMVRDNVDVFCFSGHKGLMGPQGTGGLCVKKGIEIRPQRIGGSGIHTFDRRQPGDMPEILEAGTLNGHGIAGLKAAMEYIQNEGMENIRRREQALARTFYELVCRTEGIKCYGDFSDENRAPVVSLNIRTEDSGRVSAWLYDAYGICVRPGYHCAPLMHQVFGTETQGMVRFSFSCLNREADVLTAAEALTEYVQGDGRWKTPMEEK